MYDYLNICKVHEIFAVISGNHASSKTPAMQLQPEVEMSFLTAPVNAADFRAYTKHLPQYEFPASIAYSSKEYMLYLHIVNINYLLYAVAYYYNYSLSSK